MSGFKRRYWKRICCHVCEKGHGVPRFYDRTRDKRELLRDERRGWNESNGRET